MKKGIMDEIEAIRPRAVLVVKVGERVFYASFEDNDTAKAFLKKPSPGELVLEMKDDGENAFTGELPWTLPRSDKDITAVPGDLILFGENVLALNYGEQKGVLTRLARIGNVTKEEFREVLGGDTVTVRMYPEWSE